MKEWQIVSKEILHSLLSLSPTLFSEILMRILSILIRNYCMPLLCANSTCIITGDELIFQASICVTQIRQGLFTKGWPCFLAGLLRDAVPDSLQPMRKGSAGTSRGPRGRPHGRGCHPRESSERLFNRLLQGFCSGYLGWVGSKYPQAWVCILLVMQI